MSDAAYLDITLGQAMHSLPATWNRDRSAGMAFLLFSHHKTISAVEYLQNDARLRLHFDTAEDRLQWQLTYL